MCYFGSDATCGLQSNNYLKLANDCSGVQIIYILCRVHLISDILSLPVTTVRPCWHRRHSWDCSHQLVEIFSVSLKWPSNNCNLLNHIVILWMSEYFWYVGILLLISANQTGLEKFSNFLLTLCLLWALLNTVFPVSWFVFTALIFFIFLGPYN